MTVFKAYDIRGIYPDTVNEDLFYRIGRAYVIKFGPKKITLGRDMRLSSLKLFTALKKGIIEQGCDVYDIGLVTTPMMYFSVWKYGMDGGLIVSASHNPKQYNGIKMVKKYAEPINGEGGIYEIEQMVERFDKSKPMKNGIVKRLEIMKSYVQNALTYADKSKLKKFKIVVDSGNGMGGLVTADFFSHLDIDLISMYAEPDGNFPNHEANPLDDKNNKDLQEKVVSLNADFGIALDGDFDRCAFIDETGKTIGSDKILALVAEEILETKKGINVMYDVRSSKIVGEVVKEKGGIPLRCKVGHSLIKEQMRKEKGYIGGELSGHFYLADENYSEAPFFIILKIMEILSRKGKKLSELIEPFNKYFQSGEINTEAKDKDEKIKELAIIFSDGKQNWLDGLTVEYDNWWFNVRPSNTEPFLRLNLEAEDTFLMKEKLNQILGIIRSSSIIPDGLRGIRDQETLLKV